MCMKETIIILIISTCLILAYGGTRAGGKPAETQIQCPNLDQLLAEKAAKEKQERLDKAKERRDYIKDELHKWIDP